MFVAAVEMLPFSVFVQMGTESQLGRTGVDVVGLVVLIKLNPDNFHPSCSSRLLKKIGSIMA